MKDLYKLPLLFTTLYLLFSSFYSFAQSVGINNTGIAPDKSALLDLKSTDKGFLITRADTLNIGSPAFGLMTLSPVDSCLYLFNGINWMGMGGAGDNCVCGIPTSSGNPPDCGSPITDSRDGIKYGTVEIGNQCWMSENLNHIPTSGSWCYNDDVNNCVTFGRLYDWNTATNTTPSTANPSGVQGICPTGWHIPSDEEWKELEMFLGMSQADADISGSSRGTNEGNALKSSANWDGNNSSGFNGLPGGVRNTNGIYTTGSAYGYWWSTTEIGTSTWRRRLRGGVGGVDRTSGGKDYAFSVRCVRD